MARSVRERRLRVAERRDKMIRKTILRSLVMVQLVAILVIPALTMSCGSSSTGDESAKTIDEFVVGTTLEAINGSILDDDFAMMCDQVCRQGLVRYNTDGSFAPCLATSWSTNDSKVWTFNITTEAKWSDGQTVTPDDIKFTFEYLPIYSVGDNSTLSNVKSVEVEPNNQVVITLNNANSNFLTTLVELNMIPKHIFQNITDPATYTDKAATIGCGPYVFDYFDSDAGKVSFVADDSYRDGAPNVKRITYVMYKNQDLMVMALKKGEIDATYIYAGGINYYYVAGLLSNRNIDIMQIDNQGVPMVLWFNLLREPFKDKQFREAISYCIDYDELLNIIGGGYGTHSNAGFAPKCSYGYVETRQLEMDLAKANQLLDATGYKDVDNDGIREKPDGSAFQIELKTRDNSPYPQAGQLVKSYLESVGLSVELKIVDPSALITAFIDTRDYDMAISRTTAWGMLDWAGYGSCYFDDRNIGWSGYSDTEFENLVDARMAASSVDEQNALNVQIQNYYANNLPGIALYWGSLVQPVSAKYKGYAVNPMWGIMTYETFFNLEKAQ